MPERSRVAARATAARSSGRTDASAPPYRPIGVRTASTIQASLTEPLAADAPWAEGAGVGADLLERSGDRLDVGVGEVAGEVPFDRVPVVAASLLQGDAALVGEDHEDRAAVVLGADAADEAGLLHPVDDAGQ